MALDKFISALCMLFIFINISIKAEDEKCACGLENPNRIVNGIDTGVNEYPMMVAIIYVNGNKLVCGGVIITDKHVLTASHCLVDIPSSLKNLRVHAGDHDLSKENETNATRVYQIAKIRIHPDYDDQTFENDIAILEMKKEFEDSMAISKICLPFYYKHTDFVGETVKILGWGVTEWEGKMSNTLKKVELDVVEQQRCDKDYDWIDYKVLCTYRENKDACTGDSGGPVLWKNATSNHLMVIGVISFGEECATKFAGVNTLVTNYIDFIMKYTAGYEYCKQY